LRGDQGDAWTYDVTNAQTMRKGNYYQAFGERCNQNDIIGVGIDIEAKVPPHAPSFHGWSPPNPPPPRWSSTQTVSFWRNGTAAGEAWTDAVLPDGAGAGERFHPLIELARNTKVKVNFGRESPFSHPQAKASSSSLSSLPQGWG
jgi:hypothetical protein